MKFWNNLKEIIANHVKESSSQIENKTNTLLSIIDTLENKLNNFSDKRRETSSKLVDVSSTNLEPKIPKDLERTPWIMFDLSIQDAKSQHCKYIQWITSTSPCPQCEALGATDNFGKGAGVYPITSAPQLRNRLHIGCTCIVSKYRITNPFPPVKTYWTRDPKTGKGIYVKAKHYK